MAIQAWALIAFLCIFPVAFPPVCCLCLDAWDNLENQTLQKDVKPLESWVFNLFTLISQAPNMRLETYLVINKRVL